jgi:intein/homing endonuclease
MHVKKGTLIRADSSLVPVEEIKEGMHVQSFVPVDRLFYHGIVDRVEKASDLSFLSLRAGKRELLATSDTVIPTSKGDGYVWKKLGDYTKGAIMLIQNIDSSITFHEGIISIEDAGRDEGYRVYLKKYDNFVAEGFPVHTQPLPHPEEKTVDF